MKAAMEQVRTNPMQAFPAPANGGIVEETPPCLSWIPLDAHCEYTVKIYRSGELVSEGSTEKNYFVPKEFLAPGTYTWTVETENAVREPWSFSIAEHAVTILRKSAEEVFAAMDEFDFILDEKNIECNSYASIIGGGGKSPLWRQMVSDALGIKLIEMKYADSSFGSAMLAGVAAGVFDSFQSALEICNETEKKVVVTGDRDGATCREFADYVMNTLENL